MPKNKKSQTAKDSGVPLAPVSASAGEETSSAVSTAARVGLSSLRSRLFFRLLGSANAALQNSGLPIPNAKNKKNSAKPVFRTNEKFYSSARNDFSPCEKFFALPNTNSVHAEIFIRSPACFQFIRNFLRTAQRVFCL